MEGGTISDNEAHGYGGALHIYPNAKVVMNGGTITGNTATGGAGGGVDNRSTFTLNGGTISGNTASKVGGGGVLYMRRHHVQFKRRHYCQ